MSYETLALQIDEFGVAHLSLNRPESRNSMTELFFREFSAALEHLRASENARVLVISSTGQHFSAGMDFSVFQKKEFVETASALARERIYRTVLALQEIFSALELLRIPVLAAVQGACMGGALDLICACDLRYATKDAYFCIQEINIGIMADMGTLQRLPKLMPEGVVRELAYTGDNLTAERAERLGFVNGLFDSDSDLKSGVLEIARKMAGKSPLAMAASKECINFARDHDVASALKQCASLQSAIFHPEHVLKSIQARKNGSAAEFEPLLAWKKVPLS